MKWNELECGHAKTEYSGGALLQPYVAQGM